MNMTKHLLSGKNFKDKNVVFSPLSLYTVLSMIANGSEGPTQHQLLSFLESKSTDHLKSLSSHLVSSALSDGAPVGMGGIQGHFYILHRASKNSETPLPVGGPCLSFANGMWVQQSLPLQPSFKQLVTTDFKATLASVDFVNKPNEACNKVNLWVKENTNGLIEDVLSPTMVDDLTCDDKREFSLYIFLPDAKDGLLDLIDNVASNSEFLEDMLPYEKVEVGKFRIPKFNFSVGVDIKKLLMELGLVLPFKGGLTKMVECEDLFVSDIVQKSFIEVNEKGTTAAAATEVSRIMETGIRTPTLVDFVADHPFLFMIRDDFNGTILFTGQVLNPLAKK
ncbi:hypothetical protein P8452_59485 [Trifolium repens]|nr:hypothetical protein P8452_59485 [Trifolium repens]